MNLADKFEEFVTLAKIAAYTHDLGKGIVSAYSRRKFDGKLDLRKKLPDHEMILLGFIDSQTLKRQLATIILESMAFHHIPKHLSKISTKSSKKRKGEIIRELERFLREVNSSFSDLTRIYEDLEGQMIKDAEQKSLGYCVTLLTKLADQLASELDRPVAYQEKANLDFGRSWNFSIKANPASYSPDLMASDLASAIKESHEILKEAEATLRDNAFERFFEKVRESLLLRKAPQGSHPPILARSVFSHSLWMSIILQGLIYTSPELRSYAASRQKAEDYIKLIGELIRLKNSISPPIMLVVIDFSWLKTHLSSIKSSTALRGYQKLCSLVIQGVINCIKRESFNISVDGVAFSVPIYWEDNLVYKNPKQIWIALPNDSALLEKSLESIKRGFSQELRNLAKESVPNIEFPLINIPLKVTKLSLTDRTYKQWGREIVLSAWKEKSEDLTRPADTVSSLTGTCRHCGKPNVIEGDSCGICFYLTKLREKGESEEEIRDENNNSMYVYGSITYAEPWLIGKSSKPVTHKILKNIPTKYPYDEIQVKVKNSDAKFIRPTLAILEKPQPYLIFSQNMGSVFYLAKAYHWIYENSKLLEGKSQAYNSLKYLLDGDPTWFNEKILPSIKRSYSSNRIGINDEHFYTLLEYCLMEKDTWSKYILLSAMLTPLAFFVPSNMAEQSPDELEEAPSPTYLSDIYLLMAESTNRFIENVKKHIPNSRVVYSSPEEFLMLLPCKDGLITKLNGDLKSPIVEALEAFWRTANGLPQNCEIPEGLAHELPLTLNLVLVCGKYKLPVYLFIEKVKDEKAQQVNLYHLTSAHSKPILFSPDELKEALKESAKLLDIEGGRALIIDASALYNNLVEYMKEETALKITKEWISRQISRSKSLSRALEGKPELSKYITSNLSKLILTLRLLREPS